MPFLARHFWQSTFDGEDFPLTELVHSGLDADEARLFQFREPAEDRSLTGLEDLGEVAIPCPAIAFALAQRAYLAIEKDC